MAGESYPFLVAVVGPDGVMSSEELCRLLSALVNRHRDARRIVLLSACSDSPELVWCQGVGWDLQMVANDARVRRECEIVALADAVVVVGDPEPWARLLSLCRAASIPTRVFRERPRRLPPARDFPAEG